MKTYVHQKFASQNQEAKKKSTDADNAFQENSEENENLRPSKTRKSKSRSKKKFLGG